MRCERTRQSERAHRRPLQLHVDSPHAGASSNAGERCHTVWVHFKQWSEVTSARVTSPQPSYSLTMVVLTLLVLRRRILTVSSSNQHGAINHSMNCCRAAMCASAALASESPASPSGKQHATSHAIGWCCRALTFMSPLPSCSSSPPTLHRVVERPFSQKAM